MAGTEGPVVFCLHGGGYSGYVLFIDLFIYFSANCSVIPAA
jgi:hypothetical protein